jgi:class 3 adenylate cyclase
VVAAALLVAAARRGPRGADASSLALLVLDVPMVGLLAMGLVDGLVVRGYAEDAARVGVQAGLFLVLLLVLASLALDARRLVVAAALVAGLQLWLLARAGAWSAPMAIMGLQVPVVVTLILLLAGRRTTELVARVTGEQVRRARLGRYFSPRVAERLAERGDDVAAGEARTVTVLFADLRGFTAAAERLDARAAVALLNAHHEQLVACVFAHGGMLDKYLGDGLLAWFGAPEPQPDHAARAVACARDMAAAVARLGTTPALRVAAGVHTGEVVVGDVGAASRREYTVVGDAVNVAARLEEATRGEGVAILVSDAIRRAAGDVAGLAGPRTVAIRGRADPVVAWVGDA